MRIAGCSSTLTRGSLGKRPRCTGVWTPHAPWAAHSPEVSQLKWLKATHACCVLGSLCHRAAWASPAQLSDHAVQRPLGADHSMCDAGMCKCRSTLPVCARWLQDRKSFTSPASTMPETQHLISERSGAGVQHCRAEQGGDLPSLLLRSLSLNGLWICCEKPANSILLTAWAP